VGVSLCGWRLPGGSVAVWVVLTCWKCRSVGGAYLVGVSLCGWHIPAGSVAVGFTQQMIDGGQGLSNADQ